MSVVLRKHKDRNANICYSVARIVWLPLPPLCVSLTPPLKAQTHIYIFRLTDVSVSAIRTFIINLDLRVEWVDVPHSKVNPAVTVALTVQAGQSISPV